MREIIARPGRPDIPRVLRFLGWRGQSIAGPLRSQLLRCLDETVESVSARLVWKRAGLSPEGRVDGLPDLGYDACQLLDGCREAAVFAVTLGAGPDRAARRAALRGGADELIVEACANACVELLAANFRDDLRQAAEEEGLYLTDRTGPGYGDMPIGRTRDFLNFLNAERAAGIVLSPSGLLLPRKSLTGVFGLLDRPPEPGRRRMTGCAACSMRETCEFSSFRRR